MTTPHFASVSIHVLAAIVWLGGMFFFALVGAPVLRSVEPPSLRRSLFEALGRRFRRLGWTLLTILVVTGLVNLWFRGLLSARLLGSTEFWTSPLGRSLVWKLGAVTAMIVCSALHDFVWGPRSGRAPAKSDEARRTRAIAAWTARLNALAGVVAVLAAVRLSRGG